MNKLYKFHVRAYSAILVLLSSISVSLFFAPTAFAGPVQNTFGEVYYRDTAGNISIGGPTAPNSYANVAMYRKNVPTNLFYSSDPAPNTIYAADGTYSAYWLWDAGSSDFVPVVAPGDDIYAIGFAKKGLNNYTGSSYIGANHHIAASSDITGSSFDFNQGMVLEKIPSPTFVSSSSSSITMKWTGLKDTDRSGVAQGLILGYRVYRSTDNGTTWASNGTVAQSAGGTINYTDSSTVSGTNYVYRLAVQFPWTANTATSGVYEPAVYSDNSATMSMASLEPVKVSFSSTAQTIAAGATSGIMTIESRDATGNASKVTSDTTISLSSNSTGTYKFYAISGGVCSTTVISSVSILTGTSSAQFCYTDTKAGAWTITPSKSNPASPVWASETQTVTVTNSTSVGSMTLALSNAQRNRTAFTGTNTLTMVDTYGNTMTNFSAASNNITFTVSPSATISGLNGTGNAQLTLASDFTNGVANLTNRMQLGGAVGSYTITATEGGGKSTTATVTLSASATAHHFDILLNNVQQIGVAFAGTNTITVKDQDNNTITDFNAATTNVTITESAGSGTVSGLGSAANNVLNQSTSFVNGVANISAMKYAGTSGAHTFKVTAGAATTTSSTVNFAAGALAKFIFNLNSPQQVGSAFSTASITAKDASDNTITNFDAGADNVTVSVDNGTVTGNTVTTSGGFINGVANLTNLIYSGTIGSHTFTAKSASNKTGTATANITAGSPTSIKIVDGPTSTATEINTRTLTADGNLVLYAAGYDTGGNWAGLVNVNWSSDGTLAPAVTTSGANTFTFNPTTAPASGTITATSGSMSDSTGAITVNPGALHHFDTSITSPQKIGASFTGTNTITAKDADGNTITNFDASATNVTVTEYLGNGTVSGLGSAANNVLNQSTSFVNGVANISAMKYAGTAQSHIFKFTAGSITSNSNSIVFGAGDLAKFSLTLNNNQQVGVPFTTATITALDASDNTVTSFNASTDNVTVTVNSGSVTGNTLVSSSSFVNGVAQLGGMLTYSGTTGTRTFTVTSASGKTGTATSIIVAGPAATVKIVDGTTSSAAEINTKTLSADGTLNLYAAGYDAGGNWTGLVKGNWSNDGTLDPPVTGTDVNTITFSPVKAPSNGTISFTSTTGGLTDSTGTITVNVGALKQFKVALASPQRIDTVFSGTNTITAQDADGNTITNFDAATYPVTLTELAGSGVVSGLGSSGTNVLNRTSDFVGGVATLTTLKYTGSINSHTFRAASSTSIGTSNVVNFTSGPVASFSFSLNTPQPTGSPFTTATLTAKDVYGNIVTDFDASTDNVTITVNSGSLTNNTLNKATDFVGGVADMGGKLTYSGTTGTKTFTATSASNMVGNASSLITGGIATTIKIVDGTTDTASEINTKTLNADQTLKVYAAGYDAGGNWTGLINVTWSSDGTLAPSVAATNTNTFTFSPTTAPASGTITATSGSMSDSTGVITVTHGSTASFVVSLASPQVIGKTFTGTNTITAKDADGNIVTNFNASTTPVSLSESAGKGTVNGGVLNQASDFVNGIANFTTVSYIGLIGSHTFNATSSGISGTSNPVNFTEGDLASFTLELNNNQPNGTAFSTAKLTAKDAGGNIITNFDASADPITISANAGSLTGNILDKSTSFVGGVATISDLTYSGPLGTKIFTATSQSGKTGTATITVAVGPPVSVKIVDGTTATAKEVGDISIVSDQTLTLYAAGYDVGGNWTGLVKSNWTSDGTLSPNVTATNVDTLQFSPGTAPASGTITASFNNTTDSTGTIGVTQGTVDRLQVVAPPTAKVGAPFDLTIYAVDADGNVITGFNGTQTISFSGPSNSASGTTPSYQVTVTFINGSATSTVTLVKAEATSIVANLSGKTGSSNQIVVSGGDPMSYTFSVPNTTTAGDTFDGAITAYDQYGNLANSFTGVLDTSFSGASAAPDGTAPSFPANVTFTNGIATASMRLFNKANTTLRVTINSVSADSNSLIVNATTATSVTKVGGDKQTGTINQPLSSPVVVEVLDTYQNKKDGYTVTFAVTKGGGSVSNTSVTTADDGTAQTSWTLGSTAGADSNTLSATASGLTGSPLVFTASTNSHGFKISVPPTIKVGEPFSPTIELVDSSGNIDTSYNGTKTLTFTGPSDGPNGTKPTYPVTVTFVNGVAQGPIDITLVARETTSLTITDGQYTGTLTPIVINSGAPTKLSITSPPQQVNINTDSQPITICLEDGYGNSVLASTDTAITLRSSSLTGQITGTATVAAGTSCVSLTYKDSTAGTYTLTVSSGSLETATQQITITNSGSGTGTGGGGTGTGGGGTGTGTDTGTGGGTTNITNVTNITNNNSSTSNANANAHSSSSPNAGREQPIINVYTNNPSQRSTGTGAANQLENAGENDLTTIELPTSDAPIITSPSNNTYLAPLDDVIVITGTARPKYVVSVKNELGRSIGSATSDVSGQWSMYVSRKQFPSTQASIYAEYVDGKTRSTTVTFTVRDYTWWERVKRLFEK